MTKEKHPAVVQRWSHNSLIMFFSYWSILSVSIAEDRRSIRYVPVQGTAKQPLQLTRPNVQHPISHTRHQLLKGNFSVWQECLLIFGILLDVVNKCT